MIGEPHLPLDVSRCRPDTFPCPQVERCARANDWPDDGQQVSVIDASCSVPVGCTMFIDVRAIALMEVV